MFVHCAVLSVVIPFLANKWLQLSFTEIAQLVGINAFTSYQVTEVFMDEMQTLSRERGVSTTLSHFTEHGVVCI